METKNKYMGVGLLKAEHKDNGEEAAKKKKVRGLAKFSPPPISQME